MQISNDVLNLDRRIKEGDPTCGWNGDPNMFLVWNQPTKKYQVWRACEDNKDRIICSWLPTEMDSRLLRHLGEIDSWARGNDPLAAMDAHNAAIDRLHRQQLAELEEEVRQILEFAMKRSYIPGYHEIKGSYGVGTINKPKRKR